MAHLAFVHGLNSSHHSFAYMAKELGGASKIDYLSTQALEYSVAHVAKQLPSKSSIILVGHSLGGLIALNIALAKTHDVRKVITISSPLGGSRFAAMASWFSNMPILSDITPTSAHIRRFQREQPAVPVLSIISTAGHLPLMGAEPNDSVVTLRSQRALPYGKKIEIKANHFEILLHPRTIEAVRKFIQD